ncbi:hypothetical protein KPL74_09710 [Bacillus sp. NP157]|nr:hypothetical protein KPL74_09710 [Bacillus sp. NP157]
MPSEHARRLGVRCVQALGLLLAVGVTATVAISYGQGRALEATRAGGTEAAARASFWFSPEVETADNAGPAARFIDSATRRCTSPCVRRLWWVHPVLRDIEAWSVDIDGDGKVVDSYHWTSP